MHHITGSIVQNFSVNYEVPIQCEWQSEDEFISIKSLCWGITTQNDLLAIITAA